MGVRGSVVGRIECVVWRRVWTGLGRLAVVVVALSMSMVESVFVSVVEVEGADHDAAIRAPRSESAESAFSGRATVSAWVIRSVKKVGWCWR